MGTGPNTVSAPAFSLWLTKTLSRGCRRTVPHSRSVRRLRNQDRAHGPAGQRQAVSPRSQKSDLWDARHAAPRQERGWQTSEGFGRPPIGQSVIDWHREEFLPWLSGWAPWETRTLGVPTDPLDALSWRFQTQVQAQAPPLRADTWRGGRSQQTAFRRPSPAPTWAPASSPRRAEQRCGAASAAQSRLRACHASPRPPTSLISHRP